MVVITETADTEINLFLIGLGAVVMVTALMIGAIIWRVFRLGSALGDAWSGKRIGPVQSAIFALAGVISFLLIFSVVVRAIDMIRNLIAKD